MAPNKAEWVVWVLAAAADMVMHQALIEAVQEEVPGPFVQQRVLPVPSVVLSG